MVKYLLSRQNTKPLKGYKMNPDTTPSIFNNRFAARADIQVDNLFSTMWQRLGFRV